MPIFLANIILNTAPFWTALLAYCILGENVKTMEIICMVGCFVGVVVLATAPVGPEKTLLKNGTKVTHEISNTAFHGFAHMNMTDAMHKLGLGNKYQSSETGYLIGLGCMMVAAWSQSAVGVCTRKLKALHFSIIMFTYAWIASLILLVFLTIDYFVT